MADQTATLQSQCDMRLLLLRPVVLWLVKSAANPKRRHEIVVVPFCLLALGECFGGVLIGMLELVL